MKDSADWKMHNIRDNIIYYQRYRDQKPLKIFIILLVPRADKLVFKSYSPIEFLYTDDIILREIVEDNKLEDIGKIINKQYYCCKLLQDGTIKDVDGNIIDQKDLIFMPRAFNNKKFANDKGKIFIL